ncbi:hypothetical protein EYC84_009038 [Monilinia fructicola]|uniref:Cytochrome P450 alkane hydroxylase n=1 Tax=Monilinia fructicola TaxID=38448 RepID=A0A5M9JFJ1_MONFR|nr:hypothetical protein EYC84_009038 [Monilinia fructicola]
MYGKTFQALRFGRTTIYTADPDNLKAIYGTCWKDWGTGRANAMEPFCGPGFVTRDGEEWRTYRILFASTLNEANAVNLNHLSKAYKRLLGNLRMRGKSPVEIRSQIIQGMLVTQDTTGIVLSNTLFLLSRAPEVWSRLREEVAGIGSVEDWRAPDLKNLRLLHNCIKESLRIHPLFHANSRVATTDTTLPTGGGPDGTAPIFIPTGTRVSTNFYTLHRNKSVFGEDIDSFNPDRWNYICPSSWEFMPFSHGPRSCAGRHKALGEASYIIARMAVQFERIESRDIRPWTEDIKLVVKNGNGCQVAVYPG